MVVADDRGENKLKIGTKVPIDSGNGGITYADVGFDMKCAALETPNNKLGDKRRDQRQQFCHPGAKLGSQDRRNPACVSRRDTTRPLRADSRQAPDTYQHG